MKCLARPGPVHVVLTARRHSSLPTTAHMVQSRARGFASLLQGRPRPCVGEQGSAGVALTAVGGIPSEAIRAAVWADVPGEPSCTPSLERASEAPTRLHPHCPWEHILLQESRPWLCAWLRTGHAGSASWAAHEPMPTTGRFQKNVSLLCVQIHRIQRV